MMTSNLSKRHNIMIEFATVQAKHWIKMRILNKVGILLCCRLGRISTDHFGNNAATNAPSKPLNIIVARFVWLQNFPFPQHFRAELENLVDQYKDASKVCTGQTVTIHTIRFTSH
jgi:hypothetical protein